MNVLSIYLAIYLSFYASNYLLYLLPIYLPIYYLSIYLSRRFKKKKETRLAVERLDVEEDVTVSLQAGLRTLHEAGPELKRTISGNLDEQEVLAEIKIFSLQV